MKNKIVEPVKKRDNYGRITPGYAERHKERMKLRSARKKKERNDFYKTFIG